MAVYFLFDSLFDWYVHKKFLLLLMLMLGRDRRGRSEVMVCGIRDINQRRSVGRLQVF